MWVLPLRAHGRGLHRVSISAWTGWDGAHRAGAVESSGLFLDTERKESSKLGSLAHVCFYLNVT